MSKKTETPKVQSARIVYPEIREEDKPLYANAIQVNHTPWDFAVYFSQLLVPTVVPKGQNVEIKTKPVAIVNIPVTLVRGFIKALQTNIELYEKNYGKIEIPREEKPKSGNGSAQ